MSESRTSHDLVDGDAFKAVAIEEFAGAVDDVFLDCRAVTSGVRHGGSLRVGCRSMLLRRLHFHEKIILNIFWRGGLMRCGRAKTDGGQE